MKNNKCDAMSKNPIAKWMQLAEAMMVLTSNTRAKVVFCKSLI